METSNIIQEIESTRSEIKKQQCSQISQRVVAPDFFEKVKQLLKKVKDVFKQNGATESLLEEIETMIKQMEENINAKFEPLTQMLEKWDKTLENVVDGVKNLDNSSYTFREEVKNLADEFKSLDEAGKDIKERVEKLEEGHSLSTTEIADLKEKVDTLCEQLSILPDTVEDADQKIAELKLKIQDLERQVEVLEREKRTLELGQVTWLFEKYVATFVLPETVKVGLLGCFKQMEKWLKNHGSTQEGQERQIIWDYLQENSNVVWCDDHVDAIKDLKEVRNPLAHPKKVNLTQARQEVTITIPSREGPCLDIINIVEKLSSLMMLGKLASKFEDSVINVVYPGANMDIAGLINWIELNEASEQGRVKKERWSKLTDGNEWTKKHEEALKKMKALNRNIEDEDLQDVEFEEAKKHMTDYAPPKLKQQCFEIVEIMERIEILTPKPS